MGASPRASKKMKEFVSMTLFLVPVQNWFGYSHIKVDFLYPGFVSWSNLFVYSTLVDISGWFPGVVVMHTVLLTEFVLDILF